MKKGQLSLITVKTFLAVIIFAGMGTIIVGGGYIIGEHYKFGVGNKTTKPTGQETENYYDILGKKCNGDGCCLSSLETMREYNYKEVHENKKCPEGFNKIMMRCLTSYQWCEPVEEINWRNCDQDSDCVETQADCCNCRSGGKQIGINKKYLKNWENDLKDKCQNIDCIALFSCKKGEVICENNECEFKEGTNNGDYLFIEN
ncbi:MAG: hypothetical protein KAQ64_01780 [Candidatus Pacebacteria bacterium]|nr:hypothetical protein [Candidatus Paceibacterota bacterium]